MIPVAASISRERQEYICCPWAIKAALSPVLVPQGDAVAVAIQLAMISASSSAGLAALYVVARCGVFLMSAAISDK
jgi:hypothetical protein